MKTIYLKTFCRVSSLNYKTKSILSFFLQFFQTTTILLLLIKFNILLVEFYHCFKNAVVAFPLSVRGFTQLWWSELLTINIQYIYIHIIKKPWHAQREYSLKRGAQAIQWLADGQTDSVLLCIQISKIIRYLSIIQSSLMSVRLSVCPSVPKDLSNH